MSEKLDLSISEKIELPIRFFISTNLVAYGKYDFIDPSRDSFWGRPYGDKTVTSVLYKDPPWFGYGG